MENLSTFITSRYSKFFDFEIASSRRIMDLAINPPSARNPVGFQIHQMQDGAHKIFWNFALKGRERISAIQKYIVGKNYFNGREKTPILEGLNEICNDPQFIEFTRTSAPIHSADLSENNMALVNAVIDANWAPVEYGGGLDGHSYTIKIYGENPREYNRWCDIPASWAALIPLVDFLIDVANLTPRHCYGVTWIDGKAVARKGDF